MAFHQVQVTVPPHVPIPDYTRDSQTASKQKNGDRDRNRARFSVVLPEFVRLQTDLQREEEETKQRISARESCVLSLLELQ